MLRLPRSTDMQSQSDVTTGTLTFLFTDIEGSTQLLRQAGARYTQLLDRRRAIIRTVHLPRLQWRGATATALALQRLGRIALANRFAAWVHRTAPDNDALGDQFTGVLQLAGLPTTQIDADDDLDTLIDEVLAVADELDASL